MIKEGIPFQILGGSFYLPSIPPPILLISYLPILLAQQLDNLTILECILQQYLAKFYALLRRK